MASRRSNSASPATSMTNAGAPPLWNAVAVLGALGAAAYLLIERGAVSWPPDDLLRSASTLAACLTLIGPLILWNGGNGKPGSLGDLIWMTAGLALWAFLLAGLARGDARRLDWTSPVPPSMLGLFLLATAAAGRRTARLPLSWTWTDVLGTTLGLFWILIALAELLGAFSVEPSSTLPTLFNRRFRP